MFGLRRQVGDGIEKVVYTNGVALTLRRDDRVPIAAARCYVRGGSISEELPGGRGVAHLLEHLIATAAAADMEQHADGALLNAFTTHDYTCFHWSAIEEDVASSLRRFFAGLRRAAALECDLDAEQKVVLQEIELFREKRLALFQQCFLEEMFDVHPLRYPVCGYAHLLRDVQASDLQPYLARCYSGSNLRLVVTGAFDEDEVEATVAEVSAPLAAGRRFELEIDEPARLQDRVFTCETTGVRGAHTQVGLRTHGGDAREAVAFAALAQTVNDSPGTGLRRRLADAGMSGDVTARSMTSAFGAGYFSLLVQHSDDDGALVEETMRRWLDDVAAGRVEIPLTAVRTAAGREDEPTLEGWASLLGHGEVRSERALESWDFQERLRVIEEDDIRGAVSHHLQPGNLTIGTLREPRTRREATHRTERIAAVPLEQTLPNGVRLLVLPTPSALASCQVLWRGGLLAETAATNGLCSLMARLLPRSLPAELAPELECYRAATEAELFAFCDENFFGVSLTVAGRDLGDGLGLLAAMATRPSFSSDAVREERERTADWISSPGAAWLPDLQSQLKNRLSTSGTPTG